MSFCAFQTLRLRTINRNRKRKRNRTHYWEPSAVATEAQYALYRNRATNCKLLRHRPLIIFIVFCVRKIHYPPTHTYPVQPIVCSAHNQSHPYSETHSAWPGVATAVLSYIFKLQRMSSGVSIWQPRVEFMSTNSVL